MMKKDSRKGVPQKTRDKLRPQRQYFVWKLSAFAWKYPSCQTARGKEFWIYWQRKCPYV